MMAEGTGTQSSSEARRVRVKLEGEKPPLGSRNTGYVAPVYAKTPNLFPLRKDRGYTRKEFHEKYGLETLRLSPKQLKCPDDCTEDELIQFFGPIINKNGFRYMGVEDVVLITAIELRWMQMHQKSQVLATRLITKGMARGIFCEAKKGRKVNWAAYAEWTNAEQWRRRMRIKRPGKGKGEECSAFSDDEDLPDIDDHGSTQSKGSMQTGGLGFRRDLAGVEVFVCSGGVPEVTEIWKNFQSHALEELANVESRLMLGLKAKEEYTLAEVRARSQKEFVYDRLASAREKIEKLLADIEEERGRIEAAGSSPDGDENAQLRTMTSRLRAQEYLVSDFKGMAGEGDAELEKVSKCEEGIVSTVAELQVDSKKAGRLSRVVEVILTRPESGAWIFRSIAPLPYKHSKPGDTEWIRLEKCSFCGLGFEPVWDVRLASCKHGYHEWCCRFHFENSTKCVEEGCDEEMHEGWWSAIGLVKPGTSSRVFTTPMTIKKLPDSPLGSPTLHPLSFMIRRSHVLLCWIALIVCMVWTCERICSTEVHGV